MTWGNFKSSKVKTFGQEKRLMFRSPGTAVELCKCKVILHAKDFLSVQHESAEGRMCIINWKRRSVLKLFRGELGQNFLQNFVS